VLVHSREAVLERPEHLFHQVPPPERFVLVGNSNLKDCTNSVVEDLLDFPEHLILKDRHVQSLSVNLTATILC